MSAELLVSVGHELGQAFVAGLLLGLGAVAITEWLRR